MHLHAARIRFSKIYFFVFLLFHLFAVACVFNAALLFLVKLLFVLLVCASFLWSVKYLKNQQKAVGLDIEDRWYLVDQDEEKIYVDLMGGSILTKYFVLLMLKNREGKKIFLPLFKDSMHYDDFRRLRVILL